MARGSGRHSPAGQVQVRPLRCRSMSTVADERELLARCRGGDAQAWDELFEAHYAAAGRFVFQLSGDFTREDVEEICQEAFLAVVRGLEHFDGRSRFQTWLFRIAANKARDFLERRDAAKRGGGRAPQPLEAPDPVTGLTPDPPCAAPGPDDALLAAERHAQLYAALERLGDPCREVIELRYFGDLSYEDIAAALDLNVKTVSSRLSKCLDRLEEIAAKIFFGEKTAPFPSN